MRHDNKRTSAQFTLAPQRSANLPKSVSRPQRSKRTMGGFASKGVNGSVSLLVTASIFAKAIPSAPIKSASCAHDSSQSSARGLPVSAEACQTRKHHRCATERVSRSADGCELKRSVHPDIKVVCHSNRSNRSLHCKERSPFSERTTARRISSHGAFERHRNTRPIRRNRAVFVHPLHSEFPARL